MTKNKGKLPDGQRKITYFFKPAPSPAPSHDAMDCDEDALPAVRRIVPATGFGGSTESVGASSTTTDGTGSLCSGFWNRYLHVVAR